MRLPDNPDVDPLSDELQSILKDADAVGRWQVDVPRRLVTGDAMTALLFGFAPKFAEEGIPFDAFNGGVHPDDRAHVMEQIGRCAADGGWFIAEHRVCSADGQTHRILARGKFDKDETGAVISGRGIVVDMTSAEQGDAPLVVTSTDEAVTPLERAADLVLACYTMLQDAGEPQVLAAAETLLRELGRSLARAQVRARPPRLH